MVGMSIVTPATDAIYGVFAPFFEYVFGPLYLPPVVPADAAEQKVGVKEWRLDKYDGDPPQPGDNKLPTEYITGGDELPTRRFVLWRCGEQSGYRETNLEEFESGTHECG